MYFCNIFYFLRHIDMPGEGHINAVNKLLNKKLDKTLQRRKDYRKRQIGTYSVTELEFKNTDKKELELIKNKIRIESKKYKQKMSVIFVLLTIVVCILFYFLFSDINIDFSSFTRHR